MSSRCTLMSVVALLWSAPVFAAEPATPGPAESPSPATEKGPPDAPPSAETTPYSPRQGLYGRILLGPGISDYEVEGFSDSRAVTYAFTGSFGYAFIPELVVALELTGVGAPESGIWFDVNGDWTNETSLGYIAIGPMVAAYAPFDSYVSLGVGASSFTLSSDLGGDQSFEVRSEWGWAAALTIGHDFRVVDRLWLGIAAQVHAASAPGDDLFFANARVTARGAALTASVSTQ